MFAFVAGYIIGLVMGVALMAVILEPRTKPDTYFKSIEKQEQADAQNEYWREAIEETERRANDGM